MTLTCDLRPGAKNGFPDPQRDLDTRGEQVAVLAGGCFWCVEAVYAQLDGVLEVTPGYAGGSAATARYDMVCSGATEHAEAVRVRFDAGRISLGQILKVFFAVAHDPTQLDRQGNDRGRQYRSAIFYADDAQKAVAQDYIRQLDAARIFTAPIVTRLEPLAAFFEAEAHHRDYARRNPDQPYVAAVAAPKVDKLRHAFPDRLRQ